MRAIRSRKLRSPVVNRDRSNTSPRHADAPVVHLVEGRSPQSCATTLALLAQLRRHAGERSAVLLMGNPALGELATAAGLHGARRIGVPYGRALCGLAGLRRALAVVGPASQVVCWSAGALLAARLLRPRTPRVLVAVQPMSDDAGRLVRWCLRWPGGGGTRVVTSGAALRQAVVDGPVGEWGEAVRALPTLALRAAGASEARGSLRARWGMSDERVKVLAMLADPPVVADAQMAAMAAGVARETLADAGWRGQVAVLMHPDQWHRPRAQHMVEQLGGHFPIVLEPRLATPWRVMAGCDLGLAMGPGAGGLALTVGMAAGLPIVAEPTPRVHEWLTHDQTGRLTVSDKPKALAHELTQLLRDPDTAGRLRLAARHALARRDEPIAAWLPEVEGCESSPTFADGPTPVPHEPRRLRIPVKDHHAL